MNAKHKVVFGICRNLPYARDRIVWPLGSAAWQLLESLPDQLVKRLRLRGEGLHLVLSELRLKRQNFLNILCLGHLFDQGKS